MIETGSQAPDFSLETSDGVVSFSDFQGHKNVMLIFYPLDWTGTWSKEIPDLEANLELFEDLDTQVLGVSIDTKHSHKNWAVSLGGVNFPLLSDWHPKGQMAKTYGVYRKKTKNSRGRSKQENFWRQSWINWEGRSKSATSYGGDNS